MLKKDKCTIRHKNVKDALFKSADQNADQFVDVDIVRISKLIAFCIFRPRRDHSFFPRDKKLEIRMEGKMNGRSRLRVTAIGEGGKTESKIPIGKVVGKNVGSVAGMREGNRRFLGNAARYTIVEQTRREMRRGET